MEEKNNVETIERYMMGEMDPEEAREFEKQMNDDCELATEVENFRAAIKSIELNSRQELKKKLGEIHTSYKQKQNGSGSYRYIWRVAAVFIGLILVASPIIYNSFFSSPSTDELFETYYSIYPDLMSERSETQANTMLQEAMSYYKTGEYENASVLFDELFKAGNNRDTLLLLYKSISELGAGNLLKAVESLNQLKTNTDYAGYASWYEALTRLKQENPEGAKVLLEQIVSQKSYNHKKAGKLLGELND